MEIKTTIFVEPVPKARPRFGVTKSGKRYAYTPHKTAHAESLIRESVVKLGKSFDAKVPLKAEMTFYMQRPKSLPKKAKFPITRPDWDNLGKTVSDALEKFIYPRDSQLTDVRIRKRYTTLPAPPRIELVISEDEGDEDD